jgi:hypothetical protein
MLVHLRKVAAAEDLLGSPSEVKQWVKEAMGRELDVQRLSFLDAARMAREAEAGGESSNLLPASRSSREEGPGSDGSRTIELASKPDQYGAIAKWLAVGVGLGIILLAALLPDTIKNLGKVKPPLKEPTSFSNGALPSGATDPAAPANAEQGTGAASERLPRQAPAPAVRAPAPDAGARQ